MYKLFFVFLSIFNRMLVMSEVEDINIIDESKGYVLYYENNINNSYYFDLYIKKDNLKISLGEYSQARMFVYQTNIIVIARKDNNLVKIECDFKLSNKTETILLERGIDNINNFILHDNIIYLFARSNRDNPRSEKLDYLLENDALLITIENGKATEHFYGGSKNEEFISGLIEKDAFYIVGYKENGGKGSFGNGGRFSKSVFVCKIDRNFNILKYEILVENDNIIDLFSYENYLYLVLKDKIYIFDKELDSFKILNQKEETLAAMMNMNGILGLLGRKTYTTIDFVNKNEKLYEYDFDLSEAKKTSNCFLINSGKTNYKCDIILDDGEKSLFGNTELLETKYSPQLDMQIYGNYLEIKRFKTKGNIEYEIQKDYDVKFFCNVSEGNIYPLGYRLKFTGKGYLDGESVLYNQQIVSEGNHVLELIGINGEIKSFKFTASKEQIDFTECENRHSNIEVEKDSKFSLKLNFKCNSNDLISSVCVNGERITNFNYDNVNSILYIPCEPIYECGEYIYNIERVTLVDDKNNESEYAIDQDIVVRVLKPRLHLNLNSIDSDLNIKFNCIDNYKTARYFKIIVSNDNEEYVYNYPIHTQKLYIDGINYSGKYNLEVYLVSDIDSENFISTQILKSVIYYDEERIDLGTIEVLQFDNSLNKFELSFNKSFINNELKKMIIDDKTIYINKRESIYKYGAFCALSLISGVFISTILCYRKRKKTI